MLCEWDIVGCSVVVLWIYGICMVFFFFWFVSYDIVIEWETKCLCPDFNYGQYSGRLCCTPFKLPDSSSIKLYVYFLFTVWIVDMFYMNIADRLGHWPPAAAHLHVLQLQYLFRTHQWNVNVPMGHGAWGQHTWKI